jgi:hypothetical protein
LAYTIKRVYRNVDRTRENPVGTAQMSMAALAAALLEVKGGKKLPPEDLDRLQEQLQARQEELKKQRAELRASKDPADLPRAERAALESARVADDLKQIPLRKAHPYDTWEFENEEILGILAGRGMAGPAAADLLRGGKTRVWLTREEGMPLKVDAMGRDGQPVVYITFLDVKVNQGMLPGELVLGAPPLTRMITAEADLRRSDWEREMERQVQLQIERFQQERERAARGQLTAPRPPGKKR